MQAARSGAQRRQQRQPQEGGDYSGPNARSRAQLATSCATNLLLIVALVVGANVQEAAASRRFLTGLIIGTLLGEFTGSLALQLAPTGDD